MQMHRSGDQLNPNEQGELDLDKFRDECGVFGIYAHPEAARLTYLGLYALQHRGQESCGIVSSNGKELRLERAMGHVSEAYDQSRLDRLEGSSAIGHVRYSTAGDVSIREAQPSEHQGSRAQQAAAQRDEGRGQARRHRRERR